VDNLLAYLSVKDVSELAKAHQGTVDLLQCTRSWDKLIQRSCPYNKNRENPWELTGDKEKYDKYANPIRCLANILKKMKNPADPMLGLLHVICERHPPIAHTVNEVCKPELLQLSCPCNKRSHSVSELGFVLLETVESTMGSATQKVEKVRLVVMEGLGLSGLGFRVTRQQRAVEKVDADGFLCCGTCDVDSFHSLVQNSSSRSSIRMGRSGAQVRGNIGAEGWTKMAKACTHLGLRRFLASRGCIVEGERGDVRTVWDALANDGLWRVEKVLIDGNLFDIRTWWGTEEEKERKWKGLQEILDKPADQWSTGLSQEWDVISEDEEDE